MWMDRGARTRGCAGAGEEKEGGWEERGDGAGRQEERDALVRKGGGRGCPARPIFLTNALCRRWSVRDER